MKISLKDVKNVLAHIEKNSRDMSLSIREDGRSIKITVGSSDGRSVIEYEIFDEELAVFAKVRESRELM